jgi:hypothetical protein
VFKIEFIFLKGSDNGLSRSELLVLWIFSSSGILGTRKHDVSETGSDSVHRCGVGGEDPTAKILQTQCNACVVKL